MVPAIPEFIYLYWYFSELFLQQYKCIKSAFLDSMWDFCLWCVWVNSLFYHHRYSRVSWMVTFFFFFYFPNNTNQMNLVCLQSHDNLVLDGQPTNQQLTVVNTITHFKNMNKLGEIQNVWSLSYAYVVNKQLFLEYSEQSILEAWKHSYTWNTTLKENLWSMWIQCPVFSPAQSSCSHYLIFQGFVTVVWITNHENTCCCVGSFSFKNPILYRFTVVIYVQC